MTKLKSMQKEKQENNGELLLSVPDGRSRQGMGLIAAQSLKTHVLKQMLI
jgi:hypothetical protein